jgi:glutathione gamma-glutamylcysteinyltransferase
MRTKLAPILQLHSALAARKKKRTLPHLLLQSLLFTSSSSLAMIPGCSKRALSATTATASNLESPTTTPPKRTFYQRPLPDTCVAFSSAQGQLYFTSAMQTHGLKSFFYLMEQHSTQSEPAYCGIATLTICLNALAVDPRQTWKGPWRWYHEQMLNCCVDLNDIQAKGITLAEFQCLAKCQGVVARVVYANESTVDDFRRAVQEACCIEPGATPSRLERSLVVSYDRRVLLQTGSGHFSPIAAYDQVSDMVLIMDTARFKYGVHWTKLSLLFEAMLPMDQDTGRSRGFVMLETSDDDEQSSTDLPVSILLRSSTKQNSVRRLYKQFLSSSRETEISWEGCVRYWSSDVNDLTGIWKMAVPAEKPAPDEVELSDLIAQVRSLLVDLMPNEPVIVNVEKCCWPNQQRALHLDAKEVAFLVYLASMDENRRIALVASPNATDEAKQQLLAEAQLIQLSIELSDGMG